MSRLARFASVVVSFLAVAASVLQAADDTAAFDAANKLYEQGRFADAAAAYGKLIEANPDSETLYFNQGNAWFKAGQVGRAIAAYRMSERISPRDPNVHFNLQFVRKKVTGAESAPGALLDRALGALTVNEWTMLAGAAFWTWMILLAFREARPSWRSAVTGYTATAGAVTLVLAVCVAASVSQSGREDVVVCVPEAIVRSGPLDEAKVLLQLRDGVELTVVDRKAVSGGVQEQTWVQVRDAAGRTGWLKSDQVVEVRAAHRRA